MTAKLLELLHGTSEDAGVVRRGFFTRKHVGSGVRLMLTDSLGVARYYAALRAWERGGRDDGNDPRGVVLAVRVHPNDLRADLRAYQILNDHREKRGDRRIVPPQEDDWPRSLDEIGSVVHSGEISSDDVRLLEYVRPAQRTRISDDRPLARSLAL